jgi:hypothetical protein
VLGTKYFKEHILFNPVMAVLRVPPEQFRVMRGLLILDAHDANSKCRFVIQLLWIIAGADLTLCTGTRSIGILRWTG